MPSPEVAIIGVGLHPFGRFEGKSAMQMGVDAIVAAVADAGLEWKDIQFATGGSWTVANPDAIVAMTGLTGIPFTNVIPIRRLPLHVGHSAQQNTISVDLETLGVTVVPQTYTKVSATTWRYHSLATGSDVDVSVDEFGFVLDEPEAFRRTTR